MFFVSYFLGNIVGPFAFKTSEAPMYASGILVMLVAYCVEIVALLAFAVYMAFMNGKKGARRAGSELEDVGGESRLRLGLAI